MQKVTCSIPLVVEEFLKEEAEKKGIPVSKHMGHILTAYYYGRHQPVDTIAAGRLNN